jgi:heme A synthase
MAAANSKSGYWLRVSSALVALMGVYMLVNTVRAFADPAGFAADMGLPLADPANHAFVQVYALRALFLGLCVLVLLIRRDTGALAVFALVAVVMPIGDAALTATSGAPITTVARHATTAIVLAVTASLLFDRVAKER